jgi:hypothetical protein
MLARSGNWLDSLMTLHEIPGKWLFAGSFAAACNAGIKPLTGLMKP